MANFCTRRYTAVALLVAVTAIAYVSAAAYRPKAEKRPTYNAKPEQIEGLPDYSNPLILKKLECSACKSLIELIHEDLTKLYDLRHGRPKTFEIVEVTEGMCRRLHDMYGLLMRNNMATTDFSRDESITRMKGAWINTFIENRCGHILSHYEEAIVHHFPRTKANLPELQKLICYKLDRKCLELEYTHEEL